MGSESTRFFGQPRLTKANVGLLMRCFAESRQEPPDATASPGISGILVYSRAAAERSRTPVPVSAANLAGQHCGYQAECKKIVAYGARLPDDIPARGYARPPTTAPQRFE